MSREAVSDRYGDNVNDGCDERGRQKTVAHAVADPERQLGKPVPSGTPGKRGDRRRRERRNQPAEQAGRLPPWTEGHRRLANAAPAQGCERAATCRPPFGPQPLPPKSHLRKRQGLAPGPPDRNPPTTRPT